MILVTAELCERLLANGHHRGADHIPVVKFFNRSAKVSGSPPNSTRAETNCSVDTRLG